ncbi:hypothetical protein EYC80_008229 [Monilinia laxa]|uniref:Thioesterase domain-containing protein n=1 Tax=Monilinia laxa TaxID=61186 RepID=A0A5N6JTX3_MONLA|nr:hypothetical protein EYC80_008229 [Monilinia laxa]
MENLTGSGAAIAHSFTDSITQNQFLSQSPLLNVTAYPVQILLQCFIYLYTWSTIWKLLFIILAIGNLKSLPLMWHLRLVNSFRFCLRSQRPKVKPGPKQIFQPIITESHAPLMEIDINFHKTNSSYFSDVDVGRTHLFCTLFSEGIEKLRGGTGPITGSRKPAFGIALGAVNCNFKKELKPYESYEVWTRVLTWDEKWIYLATHFVQKESTKPRSYSLYPQQNPEAQGEKCKARDSGSSVVASALSKCVFKQGRKTISPELMLKASGLLPEAGKKVNAEEWTLENVEEEKLRGKKIAETLSAETKLDMEQTFTGESEALGRHTDGTGLLGIFSTLAQLSGLKKSQIL